MQDSILQRDSLSAEPRQVLVAGASGGIGGALCHELATAFPGVTLTRLARDPGALPGLPVETYDIAFDLQDAASLQAAVQQLPEKAHIDWILVATGWLHDAERQPEKTWRSLSADKLEHAFRLNTIGPVMLLHDLLERLDPQHPARFGLLSARVGSISDNRLGGWHAYRASKAALNMLIKNFAIEFKRSRRPWIITGLQPGTTDTALSRPFQRNVPPDQLQTPGYTAAQLVKVMRALQPADSGKLFDFLGLPFDP